MDRIFFFTTTYFHFFVAVDLIERYYNSSKNYKAEIIQLNRANKSVLKDINLKESSSLFSFHEVFYCASKREKGNLGQWLHPEKYVAGDTMVVFLEQGFFSVWANFFRPEGVRLVLAPDGNKPYYKMKVWALPSRLRATLQTYRFLWDFGFVLKSYYFQSLNYGRLSNVDEIWIRYPKKYLGAQFEKVKAFSIFEDFSDEHVLNSIFSVSKRAGMRSQSDVILYVNNILYEKELYLEELHVLTNLNKLFPQRKIIIKPHPGTPASQLSAFHTIQNVQVIDLPIPVELLIQKLRKSVVISMWSAGLMINNVMCNFYWLSRYMDKRNMMLERIDLVNPTSHIIEIEELEEIRFPT